MVESILRAARLRRIGAILVGVGVAVAWVGCGEGGDDTRPANTPDRSSAEKASRSWRTEKHISAPFVLEPTDLALRINERRIRDANRQRPETSDPSDSDDFDAESSDDSVSGR